MNIFFVNYADAGIHDPRGTKIASSLARLGHNVTWVYCEETGSPKLQGVAFHKIKVAKLPFRLREVLFAWKAAEWVAGRKRDFDVGVGFSHVGGLACFLARKKTGLPFVFDYPDPLYPTDEAYAQFYSPADKWLARAFEKIEKKALLAAGAVATISPFFKNWVGEKYGVPEERVFVAPNAPDCSQFKPSVEKYSRVTLAYSGKAIPEYGVGWLLECFAACKPLAKLLLVVKTEPSWREWLYREIRRLKLERRVTVRENVSPNEVASLICKAHVAVFPYPPGKINDYAAPNKFFEYLALGLPVVSRNLPEAKRMLEEGKCGFVVSDARGFCRTVEKLAKNPREAERLGVRARKLAVEKYDWKRVSREYEQKLFEVT